MEMSAIEVLEWLVDMTDNHPDILEEVFGKPYGIFGIFYNFTPQEIVDRIEKYEAEKNLEDYDEETCKSNCRISAISDSDCADYCNMRCPHIISQDDYITDADKKS